VKKTTRLVTCALLVALAVASGSCADRTVTGPAAVAAPQADLLGSLLGNAGLLKCSPLPYDSVTQTIGPAGGTISVGPHTLVIPAGALGTNVKISAVIPSDTVNAVRFSPQGLTFARPTSLTMSYANCSLLGQLLPKQIAYTTDDLVILQLLPSLDLLQFEQVKASVWHFSDYAVAW
jgi:hypothetical protein